MNKIIQLPRRDGRIVRPPLSPRDRRLTIESGLWQTSDGRIIPLVELANAHLVNAWLKALEDWEPVEVTNALAREVVARGLVGLAEQIAAERDQRRTR